MRLILILFLSLFVICPVGCSNSTEPLPGTDNKAVEPTTAELVAAESALTTATTEFGFQLFREIADKADPTENVFISPLSVLNALVMAKNGAAGETDSAFAKVLGVEGNSSEALNKTIRKISDQLASADAEVQFKAANSIWSRAGKALVPEFIALCQKELNATARVIDFQSPGTADTINSWVAENTNDKITKMVNDPISSNITALLLNAIYFKANWSYPFDTARVHTRPFHLADGTTKDCELMSRDSDEDYQNFDHYQERPIVYFSDGDYGRPGTVKGVSLPYGSDGFYMTLLMPDSGTSMAEFIDLLTVENWQTWQKLPRQNRFLFAMPKFKLECDIDLTVFLASMGLDIAFDPSRADFSNMFVDGVGWIDRVTHKTFVQVDEHGTEAAAVTIVVYTDSIPPEFYADRPFIVIVHEQTTGAILFVGLISDPVWQN